MNESILSERLLRVAKHVTVGMNLADIGSDHAYLPCYLCLEKIIAKGIAGEVNDGPYLSAQKQVKSLGLDHKIDVRKGNGLEVISRGEVDVVTIAGMGGSLIASILDEGKDKLSGVKRLVLQPNVAAHSIRYWLHKHDWELIAEEILEEDDKVYEILVAEKREADRPYAGKEEFAAMLLGPHLLIEKNQAFQKKWKHELKNWRRILEQIIEAKETEELLQKKYQLEKKIRVVEEVLNIE